MSDFLQIKYVTISSKFIKGAKLRGEGTIQQKIAGAGYKQVGFTTAFTSR
jgi:hypothetical protein